MPRISERARALENIEDAIKSAVCTYLLVSDEEEEEEKKEEDIKDLFDAHDMIISHRYLSHDMSAGRHANIDILESYIHEYPETVFLALFCMHRASFWQLVELLTEAGGEKYWDHRVIMTGRNPRPIYQQIAVALYVLGGGTTGEKTRIVLNIGYGTVWLYTWRTTELLYKLVPDYIQWP